MAMEYATGLAKKDICNATADNGAASCSIWIDEAKKLWKDC